MIERIIISMLCVIGLAILLAIWKSSACSWTPEQMAAMSRTSLESEAFNARLAKIEKLAIELNGTDLQGSSHSNLIRFVDGTAYSQEDMNENLDWLIFLLQRAVERKAEERESA